MAQAAPKAPLAVDLSLFECGVRELNHRRTRRARGLLGRAIAAGGADAPWACQELINSFLRIGDPVPVPALLTELLPANSPLLAHGRGYLYRRLARAVDARHHLEQAAAARPRVWAALNELAWLEFEAGRDQLGSTLLRKADAHYRRRHDRWGHASVLALRGAHAALRVRPRAALRLLAKARAAKAEAGDLYGLATAWVNTGSVYQMLDRYSDAVDCHRTGLELWRQIGARTAEAFSMLSMATCYADLGEPNLAAAAYRAAARRLERLGNGLAVGYCTASLALVRQMRGDLKGAERGYRRALGMLPRDHAVDPHGVATANLASVLTATGRAAEALAILGTTLEREPGASAVTRVMLLRESSRASLRLGDAAAAETAARAAVTAAGNDTGLVAELTGAQVLLGRSALAAGDRRRGHAALRRAVLRLESQLELQQAAPVRMGLLAANREAHDALLESHVAAGRNADAWRLAARLKARELRRTVAVDRGGRPDNLGGRARAGRTRDRGRHESLTAAQRLGLREATDEIQALLDPHTALIEYSVAPDRTYAFIVTNGSLSCRVLALTEASLERSIRKLLASFAGTATRGDLRARLDAFDFERSHRLYRALLAPCLEDLTRMQRLIIVPDGPLHALPLELLGVQKPAERGPERVRAPAVLDRFDVSYVPSAMLLAKSGRQRANAGAIAFGCSPRDGAVVARVGSEVSVAALPGAHAEARYVGRKLVGGKSYVGRDASLARFEAEAPGKRLIHIAAHAFSSRVDLGGSGVVLASSGGSSGLSVLTGDRIASLRLSAELVTLSCCDGGRGRVRTREGVLGLSRAFFLAGARAVIASLWPVADRPTLELMRRFYHSWTNGASRSAALAQAKRGLRQGEYGHPFFWAPFILSDRSPPT